MSLSTVIQIAQNSLSNMTRRTGVLARNINEVGNDAYARRELQTIGLGNGAESASIRRATDLRLETALVDATSENAGQQLLSQRVATLSNLLVGSGGELSMSERLTSLNVNLQTYTGSPGDELLARAVVDTARDVVSSLKGATTVLQEFRTGIDQDIGQAVAGLNGLLDDFKSANDLIRQGTQLGTDVNDALDRRGEILTKITQIVPVSTYTRSNNDMVLLTASGATLFETAPRHLSFLPQTAMAAGSSGNSVYVDIIKLGFTGAPNTPVTGTLDALLRLRDTVAPTLQKQMDEVARSLISVFSERDVAGGSLAPMQGMFAWSGGPAFPSAGSVTDGLASDISINAAYDPNAGGSVWRLRDGGANGAAYLNNSAGAVSYSDRLIGLADGFDAPQPFDATAALGAQTSISNFAAQSSGWLAGIKSNAMKSAIQSEAKHALLTESLSNARGVNIDDEMARLGQFEQGYQASARLLKAADQMLQDLLNAVG